MVIDPKTISTADLHGYLLSAVAPRPIAFVSTMSPEGVPNLAPFSFFNAFSSNPPLVVFSANRRVRNNTTKDTLHNVTTTREAVVSVVSYDIVRQAAIAGIEYPAETSEYEKAGLTPLPSDLVKPYRVAESPVQMECLVRDIISLGEHGGAGNLVLCEVIRMHINDAVLDERGKIDQNKIDLVGRMGKVFYSRASGDALFSLPQPAEVLAIGFDALPRTLRHSHVFTGNDLARFAGLAAVPTLTTDEHAALLAHTDVQAAAAASDRVAALHTLARTTLHAGNIAAAWAVAMLAEQL